MGDRGARRTAASGDAAADLVDELAPLGHIRSRAMFGGHGIFADDTMFAIVDSDGDIYLKADDELVAVLERDGSTRHGRMPYWSLPAAAEPGSDARLALARAALDVARRAG